MPVAVTATADPDGGQWPPYAETRCVVATFVVWGGHCPPPYAATPGPIAVFAVWGGHRPPSGKPSAHSLGRETCGLPRSAKRNGHAAASPA
jgi:hypothetical protein